MSEHDIVISKLDQILSILQAGGVANTPPPAPAPPAPTSPNMNAVAQEIQDVLKDAMLVKISYYNMNTSTSKGKMRITIDIKE